MAADPATPNIFADISYFSWVMGDRGGDSKKLKAMKQLFAEYFRLFDPEVRTILFGTDWSMIAQERDFESYIGNRRPFPRRCPSRVCCGSLTPGRDNCGVPS
jgi:hypothetical protein